MEDAAALKKELTRGKKTSKRLQTKNKNLERKLKKVMQDQVTLNQRLDSVLKENLRLKEMTNASEGVYFILTFCG